MKQKNAKNKDSFFSKTTTESFCINLLIKLCKQNF